MIPTEWRLLRHVRFVARPGQADVLAHELLDAAEEATADGACAFYLVSRAEAEPDAVWVTELWRTPEAADAALRDPAAQEQVRRVEDLLAEPPQLTETTPLGPWRQTA